MESITIGERKSPSATEDRVNLSTTSTIIASTQSIRTYRKPTTTIATATTTSSPIDLNQTKSKIDSKHLEVESIASNQVERRRPSLVHSLSARCESTTPSPPPLPPKRNLYAYIDMVGNYSGTSTTISSNQSSNSIRSKSMFCDSNRFFASFPNDSSLMKELPSMVDVHDEYQHLPIAPPPPPDDEDSSLPPILPPRRDKLGDEIPPPLPPPMPSNHIDERISKVSSGSHSSPRSSTPQGQDATIIDAVQNDQHRENLHQHHNQHHHLHHHHHHHHDYECHHQQQLSPIKTQTSSDSDPSSPLLNQQRQSSNDNIDSVSNQTSICQYCDEGTEHKESECILSQIDVTPEMVSFEESLSNESQTMMKILNDSFEIRGASVDVLLIKAIQSGLNEDLVLVY
ncbi:hypothetical protein QR98_0039430 [Sarcoptes scabiei]|uniref:Uncharacterized protein n=1 Tax=Sarcoptes scabiei TaxID=52283 RepID=A0A132A3P0_SARSC|nr:hypothetical protein QR98_0039430 [Sarcoptes scabiei]